MMLRVARENTHRIVLLIALLFLAASYNLVRARWDQAAVAAEARGNREGLVADSSSSSSLTDSGAAPEFKAMCDDLDDMMSPKSAVQQQVIAMEVENSLKGQYAAEPLGCNMSNLCVMGAYQSACSGNYVSIDCLLKLLKLGVRFIDFEIFADPATDWTADHLQTIPVVGVSMGDGVLVSKNTVRLSLVLQALQKFIRQGFLGNNKLLFIQLRVRTPAALLPPPSSTNTPPSKADTDVAATNRRFYYDSIASVYTSFLQSYMLGYVGTGGGGTSGGGTSSGSVRLADAARQSALSHFDSTTVNVDSLFHPNIAAAGPNYSQEEHIVTVLDKQVCAIFDGTVTNLDNIANLYTGAAGGVVGGGGGGGGGGGNVISHSFESLSVLNTYGNVRAWNLCSPPIATNWLSGGGGGLMGGSSNASPIDMFTNYKIQVPLMQFWVPDANLETQMLCFNNGRASYKSVAAMTKTIYTIQLAQQSSA